MIPPPSVSTRTDTLFPYTTLVRSLRAADALGDVATGQLQMDAAGMRALGAVHREERLALGEDAVEMARLVPARAFDRSEEHTSELQSLMRISYDVFCLKKKKKKQATTREI